MTTYYTTEAEIEELFGEEGMHLRMDDIDPDNYETTIDRIRLEATELCNLYLVGRYDIADLATSTFVRRKATFIACYLLSKRRGNPAQFREDYEDARADLQDIKDGELILPDIATSATLTPVMSNFVMDARFPQPMRVRSETSVGATHGDQYLAWTLPYDWI